MQCTVHSSQGFRVSVQDLEKRMVSCVLARVGGLQSAPISNMRSINVSCVCVCVCVCVCACVRACVRVHLCVFSLEYALVSYRNVLSCLSVLVDNQVHQHARTHHSAFFERI